LICFLAYVLWKTLGRLCRNAGLGDEPRKVLWELAQIKLTDVILPRNVSTILRHPRLHFSVPRHQSHAIWGG